MTRRAPSRDFRWPPFSHAPWTAFCCAAVAGRLWAAILVVNTNGSSVSLWKAADLTPLGSFGLGAGTSPWASCSDGVNFWITLSNTDKLVRF
jgi:hypothetical protein